MMGRTHFTTGVTTGAWLATAAATVGVPDHLAVLAGALTAYSALLPDLDHPRSSVTRSLGPATMVLSWLLRLFVEHRGWTHRTRGAAAFGAVAAIAAACVPVPELRAWFLLWGLAVFGGCMTHIWGDARTVSGVPSRDGGRRRVGLPFRTGSVRERQLLGFVYLPVAVASATSGLCLVAL